MNDGVVDDELIVADSTVRRVKDGAPIGVVETRTGPRQVYVARADKNRTFLEHVFGETRIFLLDENGVPIGAVVRTPLGLRPERPIRPVMQLIDSNGKKEAHCCDAPLRGAIAQL